FVSRALALLLPRVAAPPVTLSEPALVTEPRIVPSAHWKPPPEKFRVAPPGPPVRPPPVIVVVPEPARTRPPWAVSLPLMPVEPAGMYGVSPVPGTAPVLQSAGVFQSALPPSQCIELPAPSTCSDMPVVEAT